MKLVDVPSRVFQGVTPALITTVDADGIPNITYLSQVQGVDDQHIALTCQFFNKTKQNVLATGLATIEVYDPVSFEAYRLEVKYVREETSGPLFENMSVRLEVIASHVGMKGVFRLRSADVYEVLAVECREGYLDGTPLLPEPSDARPRSEIKALQTISCRIRSAPDLDTLLQTLLDTLDEEMGFAHGMAFVPDETGAKLFVVASHGYPEASVGAEVAVGEGLVGMVARSREVLRLTMVENALRYGRAIRSELQSEIQRTGADRGSLSAEIPLVGLQNAQSQLALPLVVGDRLVGVLAVESPDRMAFEEWHEAFLEIVGNQVAIAIENVLLREREEADSTDTAPAAPPVTPTPATAPARVVRFFEGDDCLFADDEYLIKNVPARILWHVLQVHKETGRTEFSNRELRVERSLGLPAYRDNLESRLVLLRGRLGQKAPDIRLPSVGRGRFRLELDRPVVLTTG